MSFIYFFYFRSVLLPRVLLRTGSLLLGPDTQDRYCGYGDGQANLDHP